MVEDDEEEDAVVAVEELEEEEEEEEEEEALEDEDEATLVSFESGALAGAELSLEPDDDEEDSTGVDVEEDEADAVAELEAEAMWGSGPASSAKHNQNDQRATRNWLRLENSEQSRVRRVRCTMAYSEKTRGWTLQAGAPQ